MATSEDDGGEPKFPEPLFVEDEEEEHEDDEEVVEDNELGCSADEIRALTFCSESNAYTFYCAYAKGKGFVVRKDACERDSNNKVVMRKFVCNREGLREPKYFIMDRQRAHRSLTRTNCHARLRIRYNNKKCQWGVVGFEEKHNHELTPSVYVPVINAYRTISEGDKAQAESLHAYGVRTCHIMGYLTAQKGGYSKVGFLKEDLYNYFSRQRHNRVKGGDARAALTYLTSKADADPMFYSKYTTSGDNRLNNLFWADGVSRTDYQCFGDVLAFDSTYGSTKYKHPLVIFCGTNHHDQTVIFGCALLIDETIETYKWLLETFLEAMSGKQPKSVVTDRDLSMREAIKQVFPNASHRLCAWHLHKNAKDHRMSKEFLDDFQKALYWHFSVEEFEEHWQNMVSKHGLQKDKWVLSVYEKKESWCSAYLRDQFFAGIRTTSICEAINSRIKVYVKRRISLIDFMQTIEHALRGYRFNELRADYGSIYTEPVLTTTLYKFESEAAKLYTREIFKEVRNQIERVAPLNYKDKTADGDEVRYEMFHYRRPERTIEVVYNKKSNQFYCPCRLFESRGIPCSHIFNSMKYELMETIPKTLMLSRWGRYAKSEYLSATSTDEVDSSVMKTTRFGAISTACNGLSVLGSDNPGLFTNMMNDILRLTTKYKNKILKQGGHVNGTNDIRDPNIVKSKGRQPATLKPKKNKKNKKQARCSNCHKLGHNARTCSTLVGGEDNDLEGDERSTQEDEGNVNDDSTGQPAEATTQPSRSNSNVINHLVGRRGHKAKKQKTKNSNLCSVNEKENLTPATDKDESQMGSRALSPQNSTMQPPTQTAASCGIAHPGFHYAVPQYPTRPPNLAVGTGMPAQVNFPHGYGGWMPDPNIQYAYGQPINGPQNAPQCYGYVPILPQNYQNLSACQPIHTPAVRGHSQHQGPRSQMQHDAAKKKAGT
ncbi:protein FAR1-RELATED SEQUENCE 5-like [Lotus japonicus]|uniref:protein FAR1-RELATED SEQUENCE 5-like n=1 Tax=Lotus japonicus TaxID=34305 RepID=UPI002585F25F|nr:protein FAR1-RELATED SEQUENCE 5-like [Lotus japonicus]